MSAGRWGHCSIGVSRVEQVMVLLIVFSRGEGGLGCSRGDLVECRVLKCTDLKDRTLIDLDLVCYSDESEECDGLTGHG